MRINFARLLLTLLLVAPAARADFFGGAPACPLNGCTFTGPITAPSATLTGSGTALTISGAPSVVTGDGTVINDSQTYPFPASGNNNRPNFFSSTLSLPSGTSSGTHENLFSQVIWQSGSGTLTGETNVLHSYFENDGLTQSSGQGVEGVESSALFAAGLVNNYDYYLGIATVNSGATVTQINSLMLGLTNNGTVGTFVRVYTGPVAGTLPTNDYLWQNTDASATFQTTGPVNIGGTGTLSGGVMLRVTGPDTSSGTYPFQIVNSAATNLFYISDNGSVVMPGAGVGITNSLTIGGVLTLTALQTGTPTSYACFTSGGVLISSATAC